MNPYDSIFFMDLLLIAVWFMVGVFVGKAIERRRGKPEDSYDGQEEAEARKREEHKELMARIDLLEAKVDQLGKKT